MYWLIPLITATISLFFAFIMTGKFIQQKRLTELLYALSLYMFTIASFGEYYGLYFGFFPLVYKIYYFPAIVVATFMASAIMYRETNSWIGHLTLAYTLVLSTLFLLKLIPADVNDSLLSSGELGIGGYGFDLALRQYSFWLSGIGTLLFIGAALWGWLRRHHLGNLYLIGAGLIMGLGGLQAKNGNVDFLPWTGLLGIVLLMIGLAVLEKETKLWFSFLTEISHKIKQLTSQVSKKFNSKKIEK